MMFRIQDSGSFGFHALAIGRQSALMVNGLSLTVLPHLGQVRIAKLTAYPLLFLMKLHRAVQVSLLPARKPESSGLSRATQLAHRGKRVDRHRKEQD